MYLIVVGAEAEGRRLIEMAVNSSHEVTLIEADPDKARLVLKNQSIRVLIGKIADDKILDEAEIKRADAVVAATHDDAQNLMTMVLAKEHNVDIRISLVNLVAHSELFEKLGVRVVSDAASLVARQLLQHLPEVS